MREFHRLPLLRSVRWWDQIKHRAAAGGVSRVPLRAHGDLAFSIAIDVTRGEADVVLFGQFVRDDVLFPCRIFIPDDRMAVCQQDVRLPVAVHICHRKAVADADLAVDQLFFKLRRLC